MTDDELMGYFEAAEEPPGGFHHREHVRVAWWYLTRHPVVVALEHFRIGLRRFADARGKPELYHETITTAYVLSIAERVQQTGAGGSWAAFAAAHPELLAWKPSILESLYSPETLWSARARQEFVMPDKVTAKLRQHAQCPGHRGAYQRARNSGAANGFPHAVT